MRVALFPIAVLIAALVGPADANAQTRAFIDSAGRKVMVPATVNRVFASGPPASIAVYALAPDKLIGWVREIRRAEREYLNEKYVDLPAHGRLTGRGNTANVETVVRLKPDLIVDVGSVDATYASLANRMQAQTGIPYVLIGGALKDSAKTLRTLGDLIGAKERADILAAYAEKTLGEITERVSRVPKDKRPRVYYGRGPRGLETGLDGSINLEGLEAVGAANAAAAAGRGGLTAVSMEQVLAWNPDAVLTLDRSFFDSLKSDPLWKNVKAVKDGRVFLAPRVPFGWFDFPPGINRLIGIRWLASVLYPDLFPEDLRAVTREFYDLFYHVKLDDGRLNRLLKNATRAGR